MTAPGQEPLQNLEVKLHRLPLLGSGRGPGGVREKTGGQGLIAETEPALLRLLAELIQNRPAELQQLVALGAAALKLQHPLFKVGRPGGGE